MGGTEIDYKKRAGKDKILLIGLVKVTMNG